MTLRFTIFDTETSGIGNGHGVCEFAYMTIDENMEVIDQDVSLIDPECKISAGASGVHGIRDSDVADAPTLEEYMTVVKDKPFSSPTVFIAHNARFDIGFLKDWINIDSQLCTLRLARKLWPDAENHQLQTLRMELNLPFTRGDAHSALGDVDVVRHLLKRAKDEFGYTLQEMIELAAAPIKVDKMPFGAHKGKPLSELPKQYVNWALKNLDLEPDLKVALQAL